MPRRAASNTTINRITPAMKSPSVVIPPLKAIGFQRVSIQMLAPTVATVRINDNAAFSVVPARRSLAGIMTNSSDSASITWVSRMGMVEITKTPETTIK